VKVQVKSFNNVYGYPTLNRHIYKAFKGTGALVLIGTESLFSSKYKPAKDQFTIIVDGFAKLRTSGVPILGYQCTPSLVHVKTVIDPRTALVPNKLEISHPFYLSGAQSSARPSISLLLEVEDCTTAEHFKALQSKYAAELKEPKETKFKWLRRVINQALKGEAKDE